jgi:glycerol uptake facilitator-like aquaporin
MGVVTGGGGPDDDDGGDVWLYWTAPLVGACLAAFAFAPRGFSLERERC